MNIETAKQIKIADYLHSLGYSPVKQQGINLWYKSPFREETEASFKVNTERIQWFDFGIGQGGDIIKLAAHLYATDQLPEVSGTGRTGLSGIELRIECKQGSLSVGQL